MDRDRIPHETLCGQHVTGKGSVPFHVEISVGWIAAPQYLKPQNGQGSGVG